MSSQDIHARSATTTPMPSVRNQEEVAKLIDQGRAFEHVVEHVELGAFNGALEQGVTYDFHVHTSFAGLFTESGHGAYGHATGIGHDSGQGSFGSLVDFSDDGLLVFEFNCHGFTPGCYRFVQPGPDVVLVSDSVTESGAPSA